MPPILASRPANLPICGQLILALRIKHPGSTIILPNLPGRNPRIADIRWLDYRFADHQLYETPFPIKSLIFATI